jgi:toxin ParE1/3/4
MTSYVLSQQAEDDLLALFVAGFETFGRRQAEAYARDLDTTFRLLATSPRMGRSAARIAPGLRRHEHGAHVIFYDCTTDSVRILAIVHRSSIRHLTLDVDRPEDP